jgi:hypothetical protein
VHGRSAIIQSCGTRLVCRHGFAVIRRELERGRFGQRGLVGQIAAGLALNLPERFLDVRIIREAL